MYIMIVGCEVVVCFDGCGVSVVPVLAVVGTGW